jgi:serine/threonine-protein kinase
MPLTAGTRLGPYEVIEAIGAGGMGEVYRARDTKLDRDVAIKFLPEIFAHDPERLVRFGREAKTLASLNHPNIAAIYGIEDRALVMELVEGDDLSVVIGRGPIPLAECLPIAKQIADALEAAHEQGVVHRDLKPANVKVRPNGTVKVLDFGLAKAMDPAGASGQEAAMNSPTLTARGTQMGMIIGTAAYMAPEQAKGKAVDKRADVWAFGVVLYEMLTGRRAFSGDDVSETLASVLKDTPSIASLPADVPPSVKRLLRRCLEKDRAKRLDSMAAARLEIEDALAGEPAAAVSAAPSVARRRFEPAMLAGATGLAIIAGAGAWVLKPAAVPAVPPVSRFSVTLPAGSNWTRSGRHVIAISPDGTHLAYIAANKLFVRKIDEFEAVAVSSVSDPIEVFFSPDSAWIGFYAAGKLQKVAITGGAPVPLATIASPLGASWEDDAIVFGQDKGIFRVSANGGTPELIATRDGAETLTNPQLLRDGKAVLFTKAAPGVADDGEIVVEEIATHARTVVLRGGMDARYLTSGTGYLVYCRSGEILAVPLDLAALKVTGTPVSLVAGIRNSSLPVGVGHFGVSRAGTLVYVSGTTDSQAQLMWADMKGVQQPITPDRGAYSYLRVSPDGTRVAFTEAVGSDTDVFVLEWARNSKVRVTKEPGAETSPIWSPDSKRLAYSAPTPGGSTNIYVRAADGSGAAERLTTSSNQQVPFSWSKDGETLIFVEQTSQNSNDIYALPLTGDRKPRPLVTSSFDERRPAISPDGKWLAYGSNESSGSEIHVRPYPDVNRERFQASADGGTSPLWSIDSRAIFYRKGVSVFRVNVTTSPAFKAGAPQELFQIAPEQNTMNYDLAPDGKRFAIIKPNEAAGAAEYRVVLNWVDEMKARVGPKK